MTGATLRLAISIERFKGAGAMMVQGNSWRNAVWSLLLVAALSVRILVPQGYMIEADQNAEITITLCNTDGTWVIPMKETGGGHEDDADHGAKACSFSGHTADASAPDGTAHLPLPQLAEAVFDATRAAALAPDALHYLPPARGPPTRI